MRSSKSSSRTGDGPAARLSSGSAALSRWGGTRSGEGAGIANEPAAMGLPDRSAKAPAAACRTAPCSCGCGCCCCCCCPCAWPRAAASSPFSVRASRSVTESVPPHGGSMWAPARATMSAPGSPVEIDSLDRSAAAGSTCSSNAMRSAPLPMSRTGGCPWSGAGGTASSTTTIRAIRAGDDGLPARSAKAPASRARRAAEAAPAPPESRAPFWSAVKSSVTTVEEDAPEPCCCWAADSLTWCAPGRAADSETDGDHGAVAGTTCSSNDIVSSPVPRSSTGGACRASSDGGEVSGATRAGTEAGAPGALPDTSSMAPGAACTCSEAVPDALSSEAAAALWSGAIASRTDCEPPSVRTREPPSPSEEASPAAGVVADVDTDMADALAVRGSTNSSNSTRTVPAARSTAAPDRTGGAPSGTSEAGCAAAPSNAR